MLTSAVIEEMRRRLQTLRKKIEAQKTTRRQRPPSDPAKSPPKQAEAAMSVSPRS